MRARTLLKQNCQVQMSTRLFQSCLNAPCSISIQLLFNSPSTPPSILISTVESLESSAKPPDLSVTTLELGQKATINVFNTNNPGTIILLKSQLTNGRDYHRDDIPIPTPWGHAPRVFSGRVTSVLRYE